MERQLLSLHPLNQFLDAINRWLICYPGRQETMVLDLAVEFDALVTHGSIPLREQITKSKPSSSSVRPIHPIFRKKIRPRIAPRPDLYGARFTSDRAAISIYIAMTFLAGKLPKMPSG
jgi:hypothetical protein